MRLGNEQRKLLRASVVEVYAETDTENDYEGRVGISPRSMRTLLLDAAQRPGHHCLSPFAVLDELEVLCKGKEELEWLQLDVLPGGYHDHGSFRRLVRERLLERIETDMRQASALIDEAQYGELFDRYIHQVSAWVKGEKVHNPVTARDEDPDEKTMREVETLLGVSSGNADHRRTTISLIAAWAIDNPGERPSAERVFPEHVLTMRTAAFAKLRKQFALLLRDVFDLLRGEDAGLREGQRAKARAMADRAKELGYCDHCTLEAVNRLLAERYRDLVT
jgi:predicted Ser/Thr protein kinase